jgi:mRNA deadenylase 3'-5' endonuclease subunit Ccr4
MQIWRSHFLTYRRPIILLGSFLQHSRYRYLLLAAILSYSVISGPLHGEGSKHTYASVSVTKWTRRRNKIMEELQALKASILCLQEVSQRGLKETFIPQLRTLGLECSGFAPSKPSTMNRGPLAHKNVGCAIFHDSKCFRSLASKRVHLRDYTPLARCQSHQLYVDVYTKMNPLVLVHLLHTASNQSVVIANTHLYWNPERADIKVLQTAACANAIDRFITEIGCTSTNKPPVILCGDFNSFPDVLHPRTGASMESGPFQLLRNGVLTEHHPHHPDVWHGSMQVRVEKPHLGELRTNIIMENMYYVDPAFRDAHPLFTTRTDDFQGWVDHIFITDRVDVHRLLATPVRAREGDASEKAVAFGAIPSKVYPSDHLPIGMICKLKEPDTQPI